jgi:hypothetical protein
MKIFFLTLFEPHYLNKKYRELEKTKRREVYSLVNSKTMIPRIVILFVILCPLLLIVAPTLSESSKSYFKFFSFLFGVLLSHHLTFYLFGNKILKRHLS